MAKFLIVLILSLFFIVFPRQVLAAGEFSSSYEVTYDVLDSGQTQVLEKITLKNLTDRFYASQFTLTISASDISEVAAFDSSGELETSVEKVEESGVVNKHKITVKFKSQLAGKDKEYHWSLKFKSNDFAQLQGKIWQVSVPKIAPNTDLEDYELTLSVPVSFGDPASILPQPLAESETGGRLNFYFSKDQLLNSGILANFGTNQFFEFKARYKLENNGFLPKVANISLPPDTDYQKVVINSISPLPDNVIRDLDGNSIAYFKLERNQDLAVEVSGFAKLSIDNLDPKPQLSAEQRKTYTSARKDWESDNPNISSKLIDILKQAPTRQVSDQARVINNYVVNFLSFNSQRVEDGDFQRLGALTTLSNPDRALALEFSDLFLSLARSAKIPTRQLVGFAYSSNNALRPLSYLSHFHIWNDYFDPDLGWVMIDPTWQATSGGVDYFSKFDLNHLVFGIRGASSQEPNYPSEISTKFSEDYIEGSSDLYAKIEVPNLLYGGIPASAKITISNRGNIAFPESELKLTSDSLKLIFPKEFKNNSFITPVIPPLGHLEYTFDLRSEAILRAYEDKIQIQIGNQHFERQVVVKPFFDASIFPYVILGVAVLIVSTYFLSVFLYLKNRHKLGTRQFRKKSKPKKPK